MFSKLFKSSGKTALSNGNENTGPSSTRKLFSRVFTFKPERKTPSFEELLKSRQDAHVQKTKEMISSHLEYLESTVKPQEPLHPSRPYGLPTEMVGTRVHVWRLIFRHVYDFETIVNLREVCEMFQELIERKYVAVMLPQLFGKPFFRKKWEGGRNDWRKTMADLRVLSKASKMSVDSVINGGSMLGKEGTYWFITQHPLVHYGIRPEASILRLGASETEQQRLEEILQELQDGNNFEESLMMTALFFDEVPEDEFDVDLPSLRNDFETVIEKLGKKITSFLYQTQETSFETYVNLGRWLTFMPNLQDLIVELKGEILLIHWEKTGKITVEPFPSCSRLKRYVEGTNGFGAPFLKEIIKANPTIQEVLLGNIPNDEWDNVTKIIGTLPMTKFYCTCIPSSPFFEQRFQWAMQLTSLALWDPTDGFASDISSKKLLKFISGFKSLLVLKVATPHVQDTGGFLNLPKLYYVKWKLFPTFKTLKFLQPVARLKFLDLDVTQCADTKRPEKVLQFLGSWNVPVVFPALKMIRTRTQHADSFTEIWTRG